MATKLTQSKIERAKPGRHSDMFGLSLLVHKGGSRQWIWRGTLRTDPRQHVTVSMGASNETTLEEAREIALSYRKMARKGQDPHQAHTEAATLVDAVEALIVKHGPTWKNRLKNEARTRNIVREYAGGLMGRKLDTITPAEVEAAALRIWHTKNATAVDLLRYLKQAFAWGMVRGDCSINPAAMLKGQMPKAKPVQHQKALDYNGIAEAIETINGTGAYAVSKLAFEFLALTACRSGEVRGAAWDEFDLEARVWSIPGSRMKSGRAHRVPLSQRAVEILEAARPYSEGGLVFTSANGRALSAGTLGKLLRDNAIQGTCHGLRAGFRTWAAQCTNVQREVAEDALAHVTGDAVERSYQRGDYYGKRVGLMETWSGFLTAANVVSLRRAG